MSVVIFYQQMSWHSFNLEVPAKLACPLYLSLLISCLSFILLLLILQLLFVLATSFIVIDTPTRLQFAVSCPVLSCLVLSFLHTLSLYLFGHSPQLFKHT